MAMSFRRRILACQPLVGTFIKTPAIQVIEIAAAAELDFVVLDAEHAPVSVRDLDRGVVAGRAAGIPVLVRVPDHVGPWIQQSLDVGADGIMVPHVSSPDIARTVVRAARYVNGARGFSNSPRAGGYGSAPLAEHVAREDERVTVIAQIEDRSAVDQIDEIVGVPGIDAVFIGPADLAVAYGRPSPVDPEVVAVVDRLAARLTARAFPWGRFVSTVPSGRAAGFHVIGSDQSALRERWRELVMAHRTAT